METDSSHDNVDVRVHTKINVYGNVVFVGSISVAGVGFLFLAIWLHAYYQQAVTLAAIMVYGLTGLFFLAVVGAVVALWIRFVVHPTIDARERNAIIRGQELKNKVVWAQPNAVVYETWDGSLEVVPLFPQQQIEAPKPIEPWSDKATVLELFDNGNSLRDIAAKTGVTYYQVQKWTSEKKAAAAETVDR